MYYLDYHLIFNAIVLEKLHEYQKYLNAHPIAISDEVF